MPRYKLRTLLILLAVLPPLLWVGWTKYAAWRAEQERQRAIEAEKVAAAQYRTYFKWLTRMPQSVPPSQPGDGAQPVP
jgi:hypothetical protein